MVATLSGGEQGGTSPCHLVLDHRSLMAALSFCFVFQFHLYYQDVLWRVHLLFYSAGFHELYKYGKIPIC